MRLNHLRRTIGASLWVAVIFLAFQSSSIPTGAQGQSPAQQRGPGQFQNFDVRTGKPAAADDARARGRRNVPAQRRAALQARGIERANSMARLRSQAADLRLETNRELGTAEVVGVKAPGRALARRAGATPEATVRQFLAQNRDLYGLSTHQVGSLRKHVEYVNPAGNMAWVVLEQRLNGLPVFRGELKAALTPSGDLIQTTGQLAPDIDEESLATQPTLSAEDAVVTAAAHIGTNVSRGHLHRKGGADDGTSLVFDAGPFTDDTKVDLLYFPLEPGVAHLAWSVVLWQSDEAAYYVIIDAEGGELLFRKNIVDTQVQPATYVVYDDDSPAPMSPSVTEPGLGLQGLPIARSTFTLVSEHPSNDLGWMTDGDNTTTGNNVDAGLDIVAPNGIDPGGRPTGSPFRVFDFAYNPAPGNPAPGEAPTGADYRFGEVVNMFFWTNRYHDRMYELGFTEAARNFQQNNFGRGGLGNDRVLAEAQDYSGTNNANFATPPDGTSGRMQMYIFTGPDPDRTSGLDQEIVVHELTHGLSNRLHSNGGGLNATMSRGMGEGWSDFYARALLATEDEDVNGIYATGGYSTLQIVAGFVDNYYYGIRRFPYAVKTTVGPNGRPHNPITFADIDPTQIDLSDGAYPRGPIGSGTAFQVHNIGEVWAMALFEVRARMIARLGFAAGNQHILQLVTDGMKLNPVNPTLLQGRDSILTAAAAYGTAEDLADIWAGFATRGMGFSASAVSSASSSVVEAFDLPNLQLGPVVVVADSNDNGGYPDPGETVTLAITLVNPTGDATGVVAQLVGGSSAAYGTIAGGASATEQFTFVVPDVPCGTVLPMTLEVDSSLGPVSLAFPLTVGAPVSQTPHVTYGSGDIATPIPDNTTVEIPIEVTDVGAIGDVNVRIRLNHTFTGDLRISLVAPDGTTVALSTNRGGAGDNYGTGPNDCSGTFTVFDDAAGTTIGAGTAPFAGVFRPESPLAVLNGRSMTGTWKVRIQDTATLDTGTVGCAQIEIARQLYYCSTVAGTPIINPAPPAVVVDESALPPNGAPDPDETVTMSFPLANVGTGLTANLVATLLPGGGVNQPSGPATYGVISPIGGPVSRDFTFVASGDCGDTITATFELADNGVSMGTVSFPIQIGSTVTATYGPFENPTSITIPASGTGVSTGAPATPYPSQVVVSGVTGQVSAIAVTLHELNHTFPSDVDILLVGPGGQAFVLLSDVIGGTDWVNTTYVLDDRAATIVPSTGVPVSGTFRPTNYGAGDPFPAPAPAGPHLSPASAGSATLMSVFGSADPNGTWSLFVVDDLGGDVGTMAGGWSLSFEVAAPVCSDSPCTLIASPDVSVGAEAGLCGATVTFAPPQVFGSCGIVTSVPPSGSFFPVGTTQVTHTATRQDGATTTATQQVSVAPNAPIISGASATPNVLWAPNHRLVDIAVNYSVDSACGPDGISTFLSVRSNEPELGTGDGDTAPDWEIVNANLVRLRSERAGTGTGRVYTITITAIGTDGQTTTEEVYVTVPHDRRR